MFNQTFVDGVVTTNKPYTVMLSTVLQISGVCLLILVPLFYRQTLPSAQLKGILIAPRPPAPPPVGMRDESRPAVAIRTFRLTKLFAPPVMPKQVAIANEAPTAPEIGIASNLGDSAMPGNGMLLGSTEPALPTTPPLPNAAKSSRPGPVRVGGVVAEANVIHRVQPVYPAFAKSARIQGTVEFTAVISKDGRVEQLQLVSGHPLLVSAARDAILEWRYRPTMLNGEAVEVLTTITVNFRLSQ